MEEIRRAGLKNSGLLWELAIVTGSLLAISHILFAFRNVEWIGRAISTIVAILFLYVPVLVIWKRKRSIDFISGLTAAGIILFPPILILIFIFEGKKTVEFLKIDFKSFFRSFLTFLIAAIIIFPPFLLAAHYWQLWVFGKSAFKAAAYSNIIISCLMQLLVIALPEEFFFRGYFQSAIDRVFTARRRFLGVNVGWGWIITAAVFAFSHTMVSYQWWHFSIFFPALLFGYLRLRTGSITAPILFHAASNVIMDWFSRSYL